MSSSGRPRPGASVRSRRPFARSAPPATSSTRASPPIRQTTSSRRSRAPQPAGTECRHARDRATDRRAVLHRSRRGRPYPNRAALMDPQVAERLGKLLDVVGLRLGHVTMRQLVGFVAFLLTAGQAAAERLKSGQDATGLAYSNLAFEGGVGPLFSTVRQVFDPAALTHPTWDERLWRGETDPGDWLGAHPRRCSHCRRAVSADSGPSSDASSSSTPPAISSSTSSRTMRRSSRNSSPRARLAPRLSSGPGPRAQPFLRAGLPEKQRDRLLLWQSHRYDVRAPAAFVSLRDLSTSICASRRCATPSGSRSGCRRSSRRAAASRWSPRSAMRTSRSSRSTASST